MSQPMKLLFACLVCLVVVVSLAFLLQWLF